MLACSLIIQSHNISAVQIRDDARRRRDEARRAEALASQQATNAGENYDEEDDAAPDSEPEATPARRRNESKAQAVKRQKAEEVGIYLVIPRPLLSIPGTHCV